MDSPTIVKAGTRIVCPNKACNRKIAYVAVDLKPGDAIQASQFNGISHGIEDGKVPGCPACGTSWFEGGKLYTESGWVF